MKKELTGQILEVTVALVFGVAISEYNKKTRKEPLVVARQTLFYLRMKYLNETSSEVARAYGKTHATVLHAKKRVLEMLEIDDSYSLAIIYCEDVINDYCYG